MFNALAASVEALDSEFGDDFEGGTDVVSFEEVFVDVQECEEDFSAVEDLYSTIDELEHFARTMSVEGLSKPLLTFVNRDNFLSSTILGLPSNEDFHTDLLPDDPDNQLAIEGVISTIKDTLARWATAAWDFIKKVGEKIGNFAKAAAAKVAETAKWVGSKIADGASFAVETVKAHPYATVAACVVGLAAIPAVMAVVWGGGIAAIPTSAASYAAWATKVRAGFAGLKIPGVKSVVTKGGGVSLAKAPISTSRALVPVGKGGALVPTAAKGGSGVVELTGTTVTKTSGWSKQSILALLGRIKDAVMGFLGRVKDTVVKGATAAWKYIRGLGGAGKGAAAAGTTAAATTSTSTALVTTTGTQAAAGAASAGGRLAAAKKWFGEAIRGTWSLIRTGFMNTYFWVMASISTIGRSSKAAGGVVKKNVDARKRLAGLKAAKAAAATAK